MTDVGATLELGWQALAVGDGPSAVQHARGALERAPTSPGGWLLLLHAAMDVGDQPTAAQAARRLGTLDGADAGSLMDVAYVLLQEGAQDEAAAYAQQALERAPDDPHVVRLGARLLHRTGPPALAADVLWRAAELNSSPETWAEAAWAAYDVEQHERAHQAFARLQAAEDEHPTFGLHGMAWSDVQLERWREALVHVLDAARQDRLGLTTRLLVYVRDHAFEHRQRNPARVAALELELRRDHLEHLVLHAHEWL